MAGAPPSYFARVHQQTKTRPRHLLTSQHCALTTALDPSCCGDDVLGPKLLLAAPPRRQLGAQAAVQRPSPPAQPGGLGLGARLLRAPGRDSVAWLPLLWRQRWFVAAAGWCRGRTLGGACDIASVPDLTRCRLLVRPGLEGSCRRARRPIRASACRFQGARFASPTGTHLFGPRGHPRWGAYGR